MVTLASLKGCPKCDGPLVQHDHDGDPGPVQCLSCAEVWEDVDIEAIATGVRRFDFEGTE